MPAPVVIVPGIGGSDAEHWQTRWEADLPEAARFAPSSWDRPDADDWSAALDRAIAASERPPLIVAHSLGCLTTSLVVHRRPSVAAALLLAAVPDPGGPAFPVEATGFDRIDRGPLSTPAVVVGSADDPYASQDFTRATAAAWGARLVEAGRLGHINSASGLGAWPAGRALLEELLERTA